jgi:hypothetical protein
MEHNTGYVRDVAASSGSSAHTRSSTCCFLGRKDGAFHEVDLASPATVACEIRCHVRICASSAVTRPHPPQPHVFMARQCGDKHKSLYTGCLRCHRTWCAQGLTMARDVEEERGGRLKEGGIERARRGLLNGE